MRKAATLCVILAVLAAGAGWLLSAPRPRYKLHHSTGLAPGDATRGRLMFLAGDCASCHASPGQPDRLRLGGGMALESPYGTFHIPNISQDRRDGIGAWTTADLANALLSGVSPDGQHYYPLFPYPSFARMTVTDVRDLMAYLRTLPAVANRTAPHELPFPLTIRRGIGIWKLLFFDPRPVRPEAWHDAAWNRGRYLVQSVTHCAECHSTRNVFGAVEASTRFAGGPDPGGTGYVPNITPTGIGAWSAHDLAETLQTGITPDLRRIGSSMADVVYNLARLPQTDRDAIATYLKTLPARPTPNPGASE